MHQLIKEVREAVSLALKPLEAPDDEHLTQLITSQVCLKSKSSYMTLQEKKSLIKGVFNSMRRLDILQPLLEDPSITEIMINGPQALFVERAGRTEKLELQFENGEKLEAIIQAIVGAVNRTVNEASPIVDARLPDGSRVNVVLPPVALQGPVMTIRKFPTKPLTVDQLVKSGTLCPQAAAFLQKMVVGRYNIFVSGGTGSGKTTLLNALSNYIPPGERIITIEDSAELQLSNISNLISLETRNDNTEGKGAITVADLIRTSLRMRPDRIIVGEVRGQEALDMLQAMNTGHEGSMSTGHANSTLDMLSRLETMVLTGAPLPVEAIRKQLGSALDIIIHLGRLRDGSRRVLEICEITGFDGVDIGLNPLFAFMETGELDGRVTGSLQPTLNKLMNRDKLAKAGLTLEKQ